MTYDRLLELLVYDPDTGALTWRTSPNSNVKKGDIAGCVEKTGYRRVRLDYRMYMAHRLAFMWMTGAWPPNNIDHINGDRSDNRWMNLRSANLLQNAWNSRMRLKNKTRMKGVTWSKAARAWVAHLTKERKTHHLGCFDCPAAAHFAYVITADIAFGEFARTK